MQDGDRRYPYQDQNVYKRIYSSAPTTCIYGVVLVRIRSSDLLPRGRLPRSMRLVRQFPKLTSPQQLALKKRHRLLGVIPESTRQLRPENDRTLVETFAKYLGPVR